MNENQEQAMDKIAEALDSIAETLDAALKAALTPRVTVPPLPIQGRATTLINPQPPIEANAAYLSGRWWRRPGDIYPAAGFGSLTQAEAEEGWSHGGLYPTRPLPAPKRG